MEATTIIAVAALWYIWASLNPKLDWNYETNERILWFNNPFDHGLRKSIVLYKKSK